MKTIEQRAKAYADRIYDETTEVWHFADEVHEMLETAYIAGAEDEYERLRKVLRKAVEAGYINEYPMYRILELMKDEEI